MNLAENLTLIDAALDQRKAPRVVVPGAAGISAELLFDDGRLRQVSLRDFSEGGTLLSGRWLGRVQPSTAVRLRIAFPAGSFSCDALVRWAHHRLLSSTMALELVPGPDAKGSADEFLQYCWQRSWLPKVAKVTGARARTRVEAAAPH